mmetsp:Transcript_12263/g.29124  ORF Transcript_12263/g.29124 Transcript_12263/m.29124 type:complete len:199 (+) Transcript_12263:359-955(+)
MGGGGQKALLFLEVGRVRRRRVVSGWGFWFGPGRAGREALGIGERFQLCKSLLFGVSLPRSHPFGDLAWLRRAGRRLAPSSAENRPDTARPVWRPQASTSAGDRRAAVCGRSAPDAYLSAREIALKRSALDFPRFVEPNSPEASLSRLACLPVVGRGDSIWAALCGDLIPISSSLEPPSLFLRRLPFFSPWNSFFIFR